MPVNYVNALLFCIIQSCLPIAQLCFSGKLTTVRYASVMTDKIPKNYNFKIFMGKYTHLICVNHEMLQRSNDIQNPQTSDFNDARTCMSCQVAKEPIGNTDHEVNILLHTARHFVYDYSPTKILVFGINTRTNDCKHEMFWARHFTAET